ncbi:MAG: hypothetical protein HUU50_07300 [Candidatus Brocadiae bacterium]|nr:hypothetical protein [Candidatus Brocadiia bacterium]
MPSYEEHCRALGDLTEIMANIVQECLPLQTFKEKIDPKSNKLLKEVENEMTCIGNDGLTMVQRSKRPPCAILLGTSSAGKTELLTSFLPKLGEFAGSTATDTTPMLVRLRYPHEFRPEDHGKVTFLMPRDFYKLLSDLPRIRDVIRQDSQLAEVWDRVTRVARGMDVKKDENYDRKLYTAVKEWVTEANQWARVSGTQDDAGYFSTLADITDHFDPDGKKFGTLNPVPRSLLIYFLDKAVNALKLGEVFRTKERKGESEAKQLAKSYFMMRTMGAITDLFVEEDILKDIDVYDTAGVRVGGFEAEKVSAEERMHSQIQAFKNRWGFERLVPSVDIIIFILVLEEQQVDTEFQSLFDECRKYGKLENRLFIFLNKIDKATDQAIKKKDVKIDANGDVIPDEDMTWKLWVQTNVMDKIRGLGENFHNVFICRAPKFDFSEPGARSFLENSKRSPTLNRFLFDVKSNLDAAISNQDGGIKFAWRSVERVMRTQGSKIRFNRLGEQILPYAKDVIAILETKRVTDAKPSEKEIDVYLEKLLEDLKDLRWRNEEFRLPQRFGEFCIQKRFCTAKQVEEALQIQQQTEQETGRKVRIGQILMEKKYMTLDQTREVMQALEKGQDEEWEAYQLQTFKHVRERVLEQIVSFMEEKNRPITKGNIPVEAVIEYLMEPIKVLESELKGIYTSKERKSFQEAVQNVIECQLIAALWNQDRLRKYLWEQKVKITSSFHIRDDISQEEAIKVTECYNRMRQVFDKLPPLESSQQSNKEAHS